jgi:hypothetical protein
MQGCSKFVVAGVAIQKEKLDCFVAKYAPRNDDLGVWDSFGIECA